MLGIDISSNDVVLYYNSLDGVSFVNLREGFGNYTDDRFYANVHGLMGNGMRVFGVYHYLEGFDEESAVNEALRAMTNVEVAGLYPKPIMFVEFDDSCIKRAALKGVTLSAFDAVFLMKVWCKAMLENGYVPGIFTTDRFFKNHVKNEPVLSKMPLWVSHLDGDPGYECLCHQYTWSKKVDGILDPVGGDIWFKENNHFDVNDLVDLFKEETCEKDSKIESSMNDENSLEE